MRAIAYHYVRDLPQTKYPNIKGILVDTFRRQVDALAERYEMASLESASAFLEGRYQPQRDLCLLTFDDGLKEHSTEVTPILAERGIQGLFFLPTICLEEHRVVLVHKNHFLMAAMGFESFRDAFLDQLTAMRPDLETDVDIEQARRTYRFDNQPVAEFKYLLNFRLEAALRGEILDALFTEHLGDERAFAEELYINWDEARAMQDAGMLMGGHSHCHIALATLDRASQRTDLETCDRLIRHRLQPQHQWPFCYPYGNPVDSFNEVTVEALGDLKFSCAFTTQAGVNEAGADPFRIRRIDTTEVTL